MGIATALFRSSERQRHAIALWIVGGFTSHLTVYFMLYLAIVLTGSGDFVYRYFAAEQAALACLGGLCLATLARRPRYQRAVTIVLGLALAYWTFNASPL